MIRSPSFSAADLRRLARATDALLTPLDGEQGASWCTDVCRALGALVDVEAASFIVPRRDGGVHVPASTADPAMIDSYTQDFAAHDPAASMVARLRMEVAHPGRLPNLAEVNRSEFFHAFLRPNRLDSMLTLSSYPDARPGPMVYFSIYGTMTPAQLERRALLLESVLPAFRTGIALWQRLGGLAAPLASGIDLVPEPLALYSAAGRPLHRNPALAQLLEADPERDRLAAALQQLTAAPTRAECAVRTARGTYHLRAARAAGTAGYGCTVVVAVALRAAPLTDSDLGVRFGLTARECELVRLVAEGLTNTEVGARLGISRFTVRNHLERVFAKLGIARRGQVGPLIRGAGTAGPEVPAA